MRPKLGARAIVPARLLTASQLRQARSALKFEHFIPDTRLHHSGDDEDDQSTYSIVNEYRRHRNVVSLPRAWAMQKLKLDWEDDTQHGHTNLWPKVNPIKPRDQKQRDFFEGIHSQAILDGPQNILANATTGSGKTVASIWLAHTLGVKALFVVDSNKIAGGWLKNLRQFYGKQWVDANVGRVQQDRCELHGCVAIALIQSIASRQYRQLKNWPGLTLFDEVQVMGSTNYYVGMGFTRSRVQAGVTATNKEGEFGKLIFAHLGRPVVKSKQEVMKPIAREIKHFIKAGLNTHSEGTLYNSLVTHDDRNEKLTRIIVERGWARDRWVLILSNRTRHLLELRRMCIDRGVPASECGIHVAEYVNDNFDVFARYDGKKTQYAIESNITHSEAMRLGRRLSLGDYEGYNRLQQAKKSGRLITFGIRNHTHKPDQQELDNITHSCHLIFATDRIFEKGVDVPHLDMGVECVPLPKLTQPLGRILRTEEGKLTPEWYTLRDYMKLDIKKPGDVKKVQIPNELFERRENMRMAAYKIAGAEIRK